MSLDVLPFVPDKTAAVREVARILRPGGRFAFTTWEQLTHPAPRDHNDPQREALAATFHDHPLLESARTDYRQLAHVFLTNLPNVRYILAVARRPAPPSLIVRGLRDRPEAPAFGGLHDRGRSPG